MLDSFDDNKAVVIFCFLFGLRNGLSLFQNVLVDEELLLTKSFLPTLL